MVTNSEDGEVARKKEENVTFTPLTVVIFVIICCVMLVLLYYFYKWLGKKAFGFTQVLLLNLW